MSTGQTRVRLRQRQRRPRAPLSVMNLVYWQVIVALLN